MKDRANSVATKESTIADIKKQIDAKTTEYQKAQTRQPQIQERADALSQVNKQIAEVEAQIEKATQQYQDAVKT
ncbi:MAG: hypothetical protein WCG98_10710 [bacterium]